MNLLLAFFACEEKPVEDSGFFDIVIEDSNSDTEDTEEKDDSGIEEPEPDESEVGLFGSYTDVELVSHTITEELWDAGPNRMFNISQYDNISGFLIAQNGDNNKSDMQCRMYGIRGKKSDKIAVHVHKFVESLEEEDGRLIRSKLLYQSRVRNCIPRDFGNVRVLSVYIYTAL